MALSTVKEIKMYLRCIKFSRLDLHAISSMNMFALGVINNRASAIRYAFSTYQESNLCRQQSKIPYVKEFSTIIQPQHLSGEVFGPDVMLEKLESTLRESKCEGAWRVFMEFKSVYGFPAPCVVSKLITGLSYSSDRRLLQKAYELVFKIARERSELLQHDTLSRLCLSLGRAQMFVPASKILRFMLQKNNAPTTDVLSSVFMHMVKTEAGTNLASNILLDFCDCFHHLIEKKSECAMSVKPSTTIFNLILDACVRFRSSLKGQQIIEMMAQTGVVADAHSVLLFSYIYEMNGLMD